MIPAVLMQDDTQSCVATVSRNAFEVLMNVQRQLSTPDPITEPRTNKHKLMNKVIELLVVKDCAWRVRRL